MALPINMPLGVIPLFAKTASVGATAAVARTVSPFRGRIIKVYSVLEGVITTADATVAVAINGTAVTGASITITQSGSAAGDVDEATPTGANAVNPGDAISFSPSGASGASIPCQFMALVQRDDT